MLWWVVGLFLFIVAATGQLTYELLNSVKENRDLLKHIAFVEVDDALRQYILERPNRGASCGTLGELCPYPTSMGNLVNRAGYEYLRTWYRSSSLGLWPSPAGANASDAIDYLVTGQPITIPSTPLADAFWQYSRAALVRQTSYRATDLNTATTYNTCPPATGATDYKSTNAWCGPVSMETSKYETREDYTRQLASARIRQTRTLSKFLAYYNQAAAFPASGSATGVNLVTAVGAPGPITCSGTFDYNNIPLGCEDIYSEWGSPIYYLYVGPNSIVLFADSPLKDQAGQTVTVATQAEL